MEYTSVTRESEPWALPDVEVFHVPDAGWYYWYISPGCLPDSDPYGPFDSYAEALADARESAGYCPHGYDNDEPCSECDKENQR